MANFTIANSTFGYSAATVLARWNLLTANQGLVAFGNSSSTNPNTNFPAATVAYRRGKLYDILVGTDGTPADLMVQWDFVTATIGCTPASFSSGSISSVSSNLSMDPGDTTGLWHQVAINTTGSSASIYTNPFTKWFVGVNARASYRWVAAPGSEILWPAASSGSQNGGMLRAQGSYTSTVTGTVMMTEL